MGCEHRSVSGDDKGHPSLSQSISSVGETPTRSNPEGLPVNAFPVENESGGGFPHAWRVVNRPPWVGGDVLSDHGRFSPTMARAIRMTRERARCGFERSILAAVPGAGPVRRRWHRGLKTPVV